MCWFRRTPVISRPAACSTACSRRTTFAETPYSTALTVVNATCDERMYQGAHSVVWNGSSNWSELSQLIEAATHNAVDVLLERQLSVKGDALTVPASDAGTPSTISWTELTCWSCRGAPSQINCVLSALSFSRLEHIHRLMSSMQRSSWGRRCIISSRAGRVELSVVGVDVDTNVVHGSDGCNVSRVQDEQKWARTDLCGTPYITGR